MFSLARSPSRSRRPRPLAAPLLALALVACTPSPSVPPSVSPPSSASPPSPSSPPRATSASTAPAARELVTLSLKTPTLSATGLRITLDHFTIEDVAADPGSGQPGYGMLIANLLLEDGARHGTIEIASEGAAPKPHPVAWGPYQITFVRATGEYRKDATVTVEVARLPAP